MVDRFDTFQDPLTRRWTLIARCHGDTETTVVDWYEILESGGTEIRFGEAFARHVLALP